MIERHLNAAELADSLGFSAGTIVDWYETGDLPGFKLGGRLRFRESEILDWLESKRKGSSAGGEAPTTPSRRPTRGVLSQVPTTPIQGGERAC